MAALRGTDRHSAPEWIGMAGATPDVTIIVPVRDTLDYLPECVDSLRAQTGLRLEVLLIDDGSRDGSSAWLRDAVAAPGAHCLRLLTLTDPIGQAGARNLGLVAARGRWIGFLDSDDMIAGPDTLVRWRDAAWNAGADLSIAQFEVLARSGARLPGRAVAPVIGATAATHPALIDTTSCWQLLLRADALGARLRFDDRLRQREDRPFVITALLGARSVAVTGDVAVLHRLRDGSTMTVRDGDQLAQYARHLAVIDAALRGAEGGASLAPFRAGLEAGTLGRILRYWAPLIDAPEAGPMLRAAADLVAGPGDDAPLVADRWAETGLPRTAPDRQAPLAEGAVDLLRALLRAGRMNAARALIARGKLTVQEIAAERPHLGPDGRLAAARALTFDRGASAPSLRFGINDAAAARELAPLTLVLHVGMPKTGSSAFQAMLEAARPDLADRGVLVPVSGRSRARGARRDRSAGHDLLAAALMRGDPAPLRAVAGEALIAQTPPHTVLISAETLLGPALWRGAEGLRALRRALPFRHVRAIGLFRDPAEWVERMFREMAANPRNGFTDSPARLLRRLARAGLTDPDGLRVALEAAFDSVAFERAAGDAPDRLLTMAGIAPEGLPRAHPRFANPAVAAGRALTILALKRSGMTAEAIEAMPPETLDASDLPPGAPLLDLAAVRAAMARAADRGDDAPLPPLAAPGCGPLARSGPPPPRHPPRRPPPGRHSLGASP
jgi:hypothetical protein